jgi:plastocyanin
MKKIIILLFVFSLTFASAQTTFDLDWEQGVNGASASFTIEVGDTMRWTWANGLPHSVTSLGGSAETFDSGVITGAGTEYSYTFTVEGENPYECVVHPLQMFGTITVEPKLSVDDKFARNVQFYPNPVEDQLTIASLYHLDTYEIYSMSGKKVGWGIGEGTYTYLETSYLKSGMYFVKVKSGDLEAMLQIIKK